MLLLAIIAWRGPLRTTILKWSGILATLGFIQAAPGSAESVPAPREPLPSKGAATAPETPARAGVSLLMAGAGFEPAKAEPTDLQSVPFDRSGIPPEQG